MKRTISLLLAMTMVLLSLTGCVRVPVKTYAKAKATAAPAAIATAPIHAMPFRKSLRLDSISIPFLFETTLKTL